jgi:CRISPR/Cas system-associated protein Cas10 (large subunit of type III CRISPR-Cas system)
VGLFVVDFDDQIDTEHFLFSERRCRVCGKIKDLIDGFYLTRKGRGAFPSAYSYECKECTKNRTISNRKGKPKVIEWEYPDW